MDDPEPSSTLPLNYRGNNQSFDCEAGEKFSGQVFVLENVFINDRGTVFDHKYLYKHATICKSAPLSWGTYRANETTVHVFKEMASVAYYNGPNFYHTMLEVMPSLLLLKTVLARRPGIPVAYRALQEYFFYIFELIDLPPGELNFHMIHDNELFFVERLFLPVMAKCGRPSRALIQKLRKEYFFRPEFPAQNAEKKKNVFEPVVESLSKTENVDSKSESGEAEKSGQLEKLSILPDWRIVIGVREKTRRIAGWEKLKPRLFSLLPKDRISLFDGTLSLLEAKKLFSKTRLYIAPHGAAMTNLVFMPKDGEVLEIRPIQFNNPVYHYVAFICGLKYRLIHGNGTKDSDIDVRHEDILDVIQEIMKNF